MKVTLATVFDDKGQKDAWRNKVAAELNIVLRVAEACYKPQFKEFIAAALSLAQRVAEFEELR